MEVDFQIIYIIMITLYLCITSKDKLKKIINLNLKLGILNDLG